MSNPLSNPQPPSWTDLTIAKYRASFARMRTLAGRLKPLDGGLMAVLVCALVLVSISLFSNPSKRSSKNEGTLSAATASDTKALPVPAKVEPKQNAKRTEKKQAPKADSAEKKPDSKKESAPQKFAAPGARPMQELQLSPGSLPAKEGEGAAESSDEVRARANWFRDQRAYPFEHIPPGALQEAIRQRDLMKQRQQTGSQIGAQAVISFPGDALWHLMGPQPVNELFSVNSGFPTASGRVTAIAVDPSDPLGQTVYIGGAAGGVWKTTDAGANWKVLTDTQPSLAIGSITIDPNNPTTIYVGTGEENFNGDAYYGAGILKSINGGTTWTQIGASTFAQILGPQTGGAFIGAIAVQPGNPQIVLAAVSFFVNGTIGGIYRSIDAGATWTEDAAPQGLAATSVVFESPSNSGTNATAWAAMGDPFGQAVNGIYRSTDSGLTWTKQTSALPTVNLGRITLGYAPSTSGLTATVYAAIADSSTTSSTLLGFFSTTNGGSTWSKLTNTPNFCNSGPTSGQCFYDMAVGVHPTNPSFVVVGGGAFTNNSTSLFKTTDGGTTWTGSTAPNDFTLGTTNFRPHVDTHAFAFAANGAGFRFYVGNDGGVWRTDNPTPTPPLWVDLNATLAITQFYPGPSAGIGDENFGFGGTQDNDTELFSGTLDWANVFACGDGGFTAIDPNIPTTVYTTCDRLAGSIVAKSVFNGSIATGQTFNAADAGIVRTDRAQFIPPLTIDENNPTTLYFGTCRLFQTIDGGNTWNPISGDLSAGNAAVTTTCPGTGSITTMDVAHQSSSILLAGTSNGTVWETTTGGALWTEIDNSLLPNRHVTAVRTKRSDATGQIAYVTFSGFGSCGGCGSTPGHVFKTINGGTTWTNISGDLPDAPVNDIIVYHQGSPTFDALYIATDVGVFSCPDPEAGTPCQNWTVLGDGLPNSPVLGLAMRRSSRILRAATHGRSMWNIQLTDVSPPAIASLSSVTPGAVNVGASTTLVTFTGLNFSANTQILFDGVSIGAPTFVSTNTTQLTANVSSTLFTDGHVFQVTITDPAGADTNSLPFTVMNPVPNVTNFTATPNPGLTFASVALHFDGSGFVPSTQVTFNNFSLSGGTAAPNGTTFDVTIPALSNITVGTFPITLSNPLPGGGFGFSTNLNIIQNPGALAIFNPSIIVLGPTPLGVPTTPATNVTISNPGGAALNITTQTIAGTGGTLSTNFSFATPIGAVTSCGFPSSGQSGTATPTVAANGGSCTFGMTFTPDVPPGLVTRTGTLTVQDNGVGHPQVVQIIGLVPTPNTPLAVLSPNPVNFGPVPIGTTSPTMIVTLTSIGTAPVNVTSTGFTITVPGTDGADFHFFSASGTNPACPLPPTTFTLTTPQACDIGVNFSPTNPARIENATLNVADNVTIIPQTTALTGSGVQITSISPSIVATGGPAFTLTVNGGGFAPSAVVNVGPNARLTTFVSATQLLASIPVSDIATAGNLAITVTTPVPGGTPSEPKTLIVAQAPPATNDNINFATNATPTPLRITQDTTQATVNTGGVSDPLPSCGSGSKARSVWFQFTAPANGRVIADTRFSSYTTIVSAWTGTPGSLVAVGGACATGNIPGTTPESLLGFTVTNGTKYFVMVTDASISGPGGTLTFSLDFQSLAPANDDNITSGPTGPTVIAPAAVPYSNTVNTILATANTNGHLDPTLPSGCATGAAGSGQANSVWYSFTPTSSGTITADTLTSPYDTILNVTNGSPTGAQVACNNDAAAGIAQSQVSFAATSATTYFFMVSAFLGDGGTTNFHLTFTAGPGNPVPTITSLSPTSATAGGAAFTLTVNGTNFIASSVVNFNGAAKTTTFVSATQITAAIAAADITTAGIKPVTVTNPAPGGGTSSASNFTVNNPVPTITSLSPTSATAGAAAFTLTVNGTNFNASSIVNFNGAAKTTTFVSATQITAAIAAADITTAGTKPVTVTNPAPGGGTTAASNFTVNNPVPTITTLSPTGATAGGAAFTLTVNGTNFNASSVVNFNGAAKTTTFVSTTQITAAIAAADIATAGTKPVTVTNPTPGGGTSAAVNFTVSVASNPVPTLTSISPTSAAAGGAAFTLTLTGTNFIASSTVNFGANPPLTPTSQTATQLQVTVPAADIATAGTVNVTVTNPAPGGGTTAAQVFTVNNPVPTITSLAPTSATAGGAAFTLTVNGTNFVPSSVVNFNGAAKTTTFVSATQITAAIAAADIATAGVKPVTVTNPAPGGGTSAATNFTVNNPVPTITALSPTSATAGGAAFTLTVNGTNFNASSVVNFNGAAKTTTFVSATQITAAITAADIAVAGTLAVTVTNPTPGGGTSAATNFIVNNPAPTISSISPTGATAGGAAFTLTVNGTNYNASSVVNYNGNNKTTTFVSATQLTAAIPTTDISTSGNFNVAVTNPAPGGGTSGNIVFVVSTTPNPVPTLTLISPTSGTLGQPVSMTLTGTNFVASSIVHFGTNTNTGGAVTNGGNTLTITIPGAQLTAAGPVNVTVENPAPGGGTSGAQVFTVNNPPPVITSLSPTSATVGGATFTLTVNGTGFVSTSIVNFNGAAKTTTFVSATQITASILASDIAVVGTFPVTVANPAPGGGTSVAANFAVNNPVPTITAPLVPASTTALGPAFLLTINGTNFVAGATVNFGANPALTPTTITTGQILVTVPAADIAAGGTVNVTVTNPAPGGGTSAAATFTINNPSPTITTLSPTSATAGGAAFTLTVNGTNFVTGQSLVKFNGNPKTTTVVNATQVTAPITAADIATAGTFPVTVTNAAPGGGVSAPTNFTVNNPVPTLASIAPPSGVLGQSVNLTLTGTNFVAGSIVNFGANADSGGVVSNGGNTLTITIPAAQLNATGPVNVTVTNPAPGGGTTAAQTFTVNNPAPTLTAVAPTSGVLGQSVNLTLTGTNFIAGSIVNFGANADSGGVVSNGGNTLTITIPGAQLNAAGTVSVTVKNPAPGGGTSAAVQFTVDNAQPVAAALSPASVLAGVAAFPLTITGSNFVAGAKVDFGSDKGLTPSSLTATQITVTIPSADVATAGTPQVIVNNPAPAVGPSVAKTFTVNNPVPTLTNATSGGKTHIAGGAAFTLTVTGTNFVSGPAAVSSVVNFNGKAEPTTFVSATQVTAAIPASDVATAGNVNVTVTNPPPGGGSTAATVFTVDGFTVSGPANTPVKAGQQAMITITVTPTILANGFANPVSFTVAGLPAHTTATFSPATVTPNGAAATTTLTVMTTARGAAPPSAPVDTPWSPLVRLLPVLWLAAMLAGLYAMQLMRRTPQRRRYAAIVPLALLLVTGAVLAGCAGGKIGTPAGAAQLTITATSGTLSQATPANSVTLTVQ
jgi:hypothetical protein